MTDDEATCPECAETIKAAAKVCKHCGYRLAPDTGAITGSDPQQVDTASDLSGSTLETWQVWTAIGVTVVMLAVAATLAFNVTSGIANPPVPQTQLVGIEYMKKGLLDPSSAQFRDLYSNDRCLTGEMNAKNGFGAYTGFVDFYYDDTIRKGRLSPGMPDTSLAGTGDFSAGLKDRQAYGHEASVCLAGEKETAERDAKVAKMIAKEQAQ